MLDASELLKLPEQTHCFKSLCVFCFLSLKCLYFVLSSGKPLLILQNPDQTLLPLGSFLAFPGEFITPLSTQSHLSFYSTG